MSWLSDITVHKDLVGRSVHLVGEAVCEALWPTRCALCDMPGKVLCARCAHDLPYLDHWMACPRCGSAYGQRQCDFCNADRLRQLGMSDVPFDGCASATMFCGDTGQIVRTFKDAGEQRLSSDLARMMVRCLSPDWPIEVITFVPATLSAYRYRGFDHAHLLANEIAAALGLPCIEMLQRPRSKDQRRLSAGARRRNLNSAFRVLPEMHPCDGVLLVDDVFTTGATMCAASSALRELGCTQVYCLTFARV